jgi:hypothetical protein
MGSLHLKAVLLAVLFQDPLRKGDQGNGVEIAGVDPEIIEIFPFIVMLAGVHAGHMVEGDEV